ncbi:uncharacterized protein F5891DRAFT_950210, partial [Suillus fuscotomentosus]
LISAVTSDDTIQKGLYPEPGANASIKNGGGAKKTEHHWALCIVLFDGHKEYGSAFELHKHTIEQMTMIHMNFQFSHNQSTPMVEVRLAIIITRLVNNIELFLFLFE